MAVADHPDLVPRFGEFLDENALRGRAVRKHRVTKEHDPPATEPMEDVTTPTFVRIQVGGRPDDSRAHQPYQQDQRCVSTEDERLTPSRRTWHVIVERRPVKVETPETMRVAEYPAQREDSLLHVQSKRFDMCVQ